MTPAIPSTLMSLREKMNGLEGLGSVLMHLKDFGPRTNCKGQ